MLLHAVARGGCTGGGAAVSKVQDRTQNALGNCLPNAVWGSVSMGLLISPRQKASAGSQPRSHSFPFLFFHSAAPVKLFTALNLMVPLPVYVLQTLPFKYLVIT